MREKNYQEVGFLEEFWDQERNKIKLIDAKLETKFRYWWFCEDYYDLRFKLPLFIRIFSSIL